MAAFCLIVNETSLLAMFLPVVRAAMLHSKKIVSVWLVQLLHKGACFVTSLRKCYITQRTYYTRLENLACIIGLSSHCTDKK